MATATIKSKSLVWLPNRKQWFNAVEKRHTHLHPAGPFKCEGLVMCGGRPYSVTAVDTKGDGWEFKLSDFRFAALNPKTGQ